MLGLGPVGLCAVQAAIAAGAEKVIAVDTVDERLEMARSFGAEAVHLTEEDPRAAVKAATEGRGVDAVIDAVGHPDVLELACKMARKCGTVSATGVYAERADVHMGIVWLKALTLKTGPRERDQARRPGARGARRRAGSTRRPLVTHHMKLDEAPEAYEVYDRREALKIVLTP